MDLAKDPKPKPKSIAIVGAVIAAVVTALIVGYLSTSSISTSKYPTTTANAPMDRPPHLDPSRSLLVRGTVEATGFGAYSYVLFRERPDGVMRDRYVRIVYRVIRSAEQTADMLNQGYKREELNVIHFPVVRQPTRTATPSEAAAWIVDNYDYTRAKRLLRRCPQAKATGPYLVSSLMPLEALHANQTPYVHDMTRATDDTWELWVAAFIETSSRPNQWNNTSMMAAMLHVRDVLATIASAGKPVLDARDKVLMWFRPPK